MKLVINGQEVEIPDPATITRLLELRSPRPPFAIEVNKRHVRRPDYDKTDLHNGDRVEIVTLVGGG